MNNNNPVCWEEHRIKLLRTLTEIENEMRKNKAPDNAFEGYYSLRRDVESCETKEDYEIFIEDVKKYILNFFSMRTEKKPDTIEQPQFWEKHRIDVLRTISEIELDMRNNNATAEDLEGCFGLRRAAESCKNEDDYQNFISSLKKSLVRLRKEEAENLENQQNNRKIQ